MSRKDLNGYLLTSNVLLKFINNFFLVLLNNYNLFVELEKYSNVKLNFLHKLIDIDFDTKVLTFQTLVNTCMI